jgi:hypothetical protein
MSTSNQKFILIGPHAGKTLAVNGHEFVDGEYEFVGSHEQIATLTRIFSFYGAVTAQEAHTMALAAELAAMRKPVAATQEELASAVAPATQAAPVAEPAATPAPAAATSVAEAMTLGEAIGALDPEVDAHWTSNNLPSLDHLGELTGKKVARSDVDTVADGYTRAKARAARA